MSSIGTPAVGVSGPFAPKVETEANPNPNLEVAESASGHRYFTNAVLQSAIDDALDGMDPEDTYAVVAHHIYNNDGSRIENVTTVSAVFKLKDSGKWSIGVGAYKDWTKGDLGAEAKVIFRG